MRLTFTQAALAGFAGFAVLGLVTAVAPAFLGQGLGVTSRAIVGFVGFVVFAASTAGQVIVQFVPERMAIPASASALIAGMASLALGLAASSLVLAREIGLRAAGMTFAAVVAGLSAVVLILPSYTHSRARRARRAGTRGRPVADAGSAS
jgi:hypothetical protein